MSDDTFSDAAVRFEKALQPNVEEQMHAGQTSDFIKSNRTIRKHAYSNILKFYNKKQ